MRKALLILFAVFSISALHAQLNMSLIGQYDYSPRLNDIWGWADPDTGVEYALVGAETGVSIVSLADPENPEEVAWIPGEFSTWRDLKTYGDWCYVVTDQPGTSEGVTVIDLSDLPNSAPYYHWTPDLPGLGTLETCHNLYIEEATGYCYLAGCDVNGGIIVIDVFTNPGEPEFVSVATLPYAHDVYVRGDTIYSSEIYAGVFSIYNAADKQNVQFLGSQETPFEFTHNAWLSDNSKYLFTTDELANAPIGSYDVSDPENIEELDTYVPLETLGEGVIPHNVHVWNDWVIISYYTDGGIILDAAQPDNLIEVGNFDTFFGGNGGFDGAWGAYPFLPSQLVLITDRDNGLYVLEADYKRACYLEGHVTSSYDGSNLSGVDVEIQSNQLNAATTDLLGDYKTGQVLNGTFDVEFTKPGFVSVTESVELENGEITILDVEMDPVGVIQGSVVRDADGNPVPNAQVLLAGDQEFTAQTDANGNFTLVGVEPGNYDVLAGAWGYVTVLENMDINSGTVVEMTLTEGYYDDFAVELNWEVSGDAETGEWEYVVPDGSTYNGQLSSPDEDVNDDLLNRCYVTGNGGNGGANDVDDGTTTLTSPVMDLSDYNQPLLRFQAFFFNDGGFGNPDDALVFRITNGSETIDLGSITESQVDWTEPFEYDLSLLLDLTDQMQMIVEVSDLPGSGHIVEAAFDFFQVIEGDPSMPTATEDIEANQIRMQVTPNPASEPFTVSYESQNGADPTFLEVYDLSGRLLDKYPLAPGSKAFELTETFAPGMYLLRLTVDGRTLAQQKVVQLR